MKLNNKLRSDCCFQVITVEYVQLQVKTNLRQPNPFVCMLQDISNPTQMQNQPLFSEFIFKVDATLL